MNITLDQIKEIVMERSGREDIYVFDNYETAFVGVTEEGLPVYDYEKMIEYLKQHDGMTDEEAIEWIDYNTIRAMPYYQPGPVILYPITEDMVEEIPAPINGL